MIPINIYQRKYQNKMRNENKNATSSKRKLAFNKAALKSTNKYILKLDVESHKICYQKL